MITVKKAKADGYNAIALDNYGLRNSWKACGSFSGPGGAWVQKYSSSNPEKDPQYTKDVLDWTKRAAEAIKLLSAEAKEAKEALATERAAAQAKSHVKPSAGVWVPPLRCVGDKCSALGRTIYL